MKQTITYVASLVFSFAFLGQIIAQNPLKFVNSVGSSDQGQQPMLNGYIPSMTVTQDGKTAYFSKVSEQKPLYGLFSKKEMVHEIYRAQKVNGKWTNITKMEVCPKYASAKHPTVSDDGKRLFFASNMKGTYGKFDIYVADINKDGTLGVSKNLGPKVNTKEDELYPNLHNGTLLFFASEGRDGFGGLDLYATQVAYNSLTTSVNLGSHINSSRDDYAIQLDLEQGLSYVVSNRGENNAVEQVTISYRRKAMNDDTMVASRDENLQTALNANSAYEYTSTSFED